MTRWRDGQLALGQVVLFGVLAAPETLMDPVLRRIDTLLDDEALVGAVWRVLRERRPQSARRGRPATPAEVVLRLLVLKHLRRWSYEQLEWEVRGNIVYRHFCRLAGGRVPDAKTLVRLGQLLEARVLRDVFERVVGIAVARKVTRGRRMRLDTTVVEAPIRHPTDSGLCADAIRVLAAGAAGVAAGVTLAAPVRNVHRSVARRLHEIGQAMRRRGEAAPAALRRPYQRLLRITRRVLRQAAQCAAAAAGQSSSRRRNSAASPRVRPAGHDPAAQRIITQTRARIVRGVTTTADKIVSLFEPDAQVLRRGKPHRPTEFGTFVKVQETEGGIVSDIATVPGKADAPLLVPAVEQHQRMFGRPLPGERGSWLPLERRGTSVAGAWRAASRDPETRLSLARAHSARAAALVPSWARLARRRRSTHRALKAPLRDGPELVSGPPGMARTIYWAAIANNLTAIAARTA